MSVVLLGFCITQIVFFAFENNHRDDVITAAPFIFFLTVCLFTAELIVRSLYELQQRAQRSMMQVYRQHQQKDEKRKQEKLERLQKWMSYWTNWFQK
jgi:NADH:ubiquinone oxidoreductase subunit B-like Fe-S oxidoreductase